jgi:hypothetical protein
MTRRQWSLVATCVALLTFTALWLFLWRRPLAHNGWQITPNDVYWPLSAWKSTGLALLFFGGLAALAAYDRFRRAKTRKEQTQSTVLSVLMLMSFATVWPWVLLGPGGAQNLVMVYWSDISNEYFGTAYQVEDAREFSRDYTQRQQPKSVQIAHVATHPPGAVLFFYGARRAYETSPFLQRTMTAFAEWIIRANLNSVAILSNEVRATAARSAGESDPPPLPLSAVPGALWAALLCSLALGLCVPAIYWLASGAPLKHTPNEARGLLAAALFAFVPTVGLYAFTLDALIACGATWTLALTAHALSSQKNHWLLLGGMVMGLTSFLSIGALATGAIVGLALGFAAWPHENRGMLFLRHASFFGAGFFLAWVLLLLIFPMQPLEVFNRARAAHHFATLSNRGNWMLFNLPFFALFCGWPIVVSSLMAWREKSSTAQSAILLGKAALWAMLLLTLSGNVKGEVERLWLFLVPPLCALAASVIEPHQRRLWLPLLALQAAQSILMAVGLAPLLKPL